MEKTKGVVADVSGTEMACQSEVLSLTILGTSWPGIPRLLEIF